MEEPSDEEPVAEESIAEEPSDEEPVAEEPIVEKLIAEEPNAENLLDESGNFEEPENTFGKGYDYTKHFPTDEKFSSLDVLKEHLKSTAKGFGFLLSTSDSRNIKSLLGRKSHDTTVCKNHGDPKPKKQTTKDTGSSKCFCPFKLQCYKEKDYWKFNIQNGVHNHDMIKYMEAHSQARRLNVDERNFVQNMAKGFAKPGAILKALKVFSPGNLSNRKDIYNHMAKDRLVEMRGRSHMQQLMHLLQTNNYISFHRTNPVTDHVEDLFFIHPESVRLFRAFPHILCMDCTYSTNMFNLPLLEIVGVTSTHNTYCVAFVFLHDEKQPTYEWVLGCLREVLSGYSLPRVVVTDRDRALMNSVSLIFPDSIHLLCKWHISKNVQAYCSDKLPKAEFPQFHCAFRNLLDSESESEYFSARMQMDREYANFPIVMKYINALLNETQQKVVACWTNKSMHLGNRTSNRAEGQHHVLKNALSSSRNNLEGVLLTIDTLLVEQLNTIKKNLGISKSTPRDNHRIVLFRNIIGKCSAYALDLILKEVAKSLPGSADLTCCTCEITLVYNLPCSHVIQSHIDQECPIPLACIDAHWRKLEYDNPTSEVDDAPDDFEHYLSNLRQVYDSTVDPVLKQALKTKIEHIYEPTKITARPPVPKPKKRGKTVGKAYGVNSTKRHPSVFELTQSHMNETPRRHSFSGTRKSSTFAKSHSVRERGGSSLLEAPLPKVRDVMHLHLHSFAQIFHDWIEFIHDTNPDGNCGFRAIAKGLGMNNDEEDWPLVRTHMLKELNHNYTYYLNLFDDNRGMVAFNNVKEKLEHWAGPTISRFWFKTHEMAFLAANTYNICIIIMSEAGCCTYLPLIKGPDRKSGCVLWLGNVNKNHFVNICMGPNPPFPPICPLWIKWRLPEAEPWKALFKENFDLFRSINNPTNKDKVFYPLLDED